MTANGGVMDTNDIITQIETEISNLQQARAILIGVGPAKIGPDRSKSTEPNVIKAKRRKLSAKGRAAISAAMKARWAKKREATKPKVKKTAAK
jgi:menaquinone-dependent protoporphyrinogen IX oxidase